MTFRIRKMEGDLAEHAAADDLYRQHLARFCKRSNACFWKFFYWDFFHDGEISKVEISSDFRTIKMKITCPNIRRYEGEHFEYVNADFRVIFRGVRHLLLTPDLDAGSEESMGSLGRALQYRYGEINTHPAAGCSGPPDAGFDVSNSLLMELVADESTWLEMVFDRVEVVPTEPLAFSLMETDPRFRMPTYHPAEPAEGGAGQAATSPEFP